ncbi:glutamate receptor ionotropic, kainate 1 [Musca domestica]|uniref:Glutamate receptor ionotropic, kainate 1 n=1 Tax=Musca domestica TaxID=7370 RepID=A0A9J7DFD0_MUSDO|nr:glutamate receptor ionotropic, kainate 1 [Musca domestica]
MDFIQITVIIWLIVPAIFANDLNIAFWIDPVQKDIYGDIAATLKEIEGLHLETKIVDTVMVIEPGDDDDDEVDSMETSERNMRTFCDILSVSGISIILDFTYLPWHQGLDYVQAHGIPYMKVDRILRPFMQMFSAFLQQKDATEVVMLLQNERDKREAIEEMIRGLPFRTLILNAGDGNRTDFVTILRDLRPSPGYYGIFAKGSNMNSIFDKILKGNVFARPAEWHFIFLDTRDRVFKYKKQAENGNKFSVNPKAVCKSLQMKDAYCQSGFTFQRALLLEIFRALIDIRQSRWLEPILMDCNVTTSETMEYLKDFDILDHFKLNDFMTFSPVNPENTFDDERPEMIPPLSYSVNVSINFYSSEHEAVTDLAVWQNGEMKKINHTISPAKRFFRIGTTEAIPWSYYRKNPNTGELLLDANGQPMWEGFCIDMIESLAEKMNFDYEIVTPKKGKFGRRDPVTHEWDGLVGDLVSGETDFVVAALKMYSEREEYIDFLAPYFEQTGITIVMRKPVKQTSLFKFMTVLRLEVWMSIVGALVSTAVAIWLLDTYSPYSAKNNKKAYPYPCRDFTLRESFWFALTSFTPQGGGEAPKAISARILVAAYWLFVVLMLATFTANLAAFLTVERMQTPVQSLEQLARQSRINYTVVEGSDTHHYFINMDFAEKTLYRMWKELALNASRDFHKFRVWDYPIKEQYGRILLAINSSMPVADAEEGFRKVNEREGADYAFIHDSSEIKYEITMNCNLTEVGEVFAEQPYAVAVQQGSHLADPISFAILELQKDRYFEELKAKYWNRSRSNCPLSEEEQGITLESLGGVFIATLCGLGLAMISLVFEVLWNKRKQKKIAGDIVQVKPVDVKDPPVEVWHSEAKLTPPPSFETATFRGRKIPSGITLGSEFKPGRVGLNRRLLSRRPDEDTPPKDELPAYME